MLQSVLNLNGVSSLNRTQKQVIKGGTGELNDFCHDDSECNYGLVCAGCLCRPIGGPV